MNERFHTPTDKIQIGPHSPLVFLAGPVQGSPDWQTPTADILLAARTDLEVASPRRTIEHVGSFDANEAEKQVAWEHTALRRSAQLGAIIIWLSAQDHALEYTKDRAYAQTTRIAIGEALGWARPVANLKNPDWDFPVNVGIDPRYGDNGGGSESYIRIKSKLLGIPVYDSLDQVIEETIRHVPRFGD